MTLTYKAILVRALAAGLLTGLLMALFLTLVVEHAVDEAIRIEETTAAPSDAPAHTHGDEPAAAAEEAPRFSRPQQEVGGALAVVLDALMVAAIFATVFAFVRHRLVAATDFGRTVTLAAAAFGATALFPMLKYPANPPAVGDPATVGRRTVLYLGAVVLSIAATALLGALSRRLRSRFDDPTRVVLVAAAAIVLYSVLFVVLPASPDSIPLTVPADLIWRFRIQSLGTLALLWAGLGLGLGWLLHRAVEPARAPRPDVAVAT